MVDSATPDCEQLGELARRGQIAKAVALLAASSSPNAVSCSITSSGSALSAAI